MSKIEIQNISKRFGDKLVLDNISLKIEEGEIFGLIGPNGAGKSTLINIIIGLLKSDNGQVSIDGISLKTDDVKYKSKIGLVPQELALVEEMSAQDNLEYFGTFYGLYGKALKQAIGEVLEMTGLYDKRKQKVKAFSGGMKRRLNIAVAMMHHPEILIMDEPTVGVDPQSRNHIFDCIRKVNREENTTVIYTSHYMEEVEQLCNRIFIIDEGRKISYGDLYSIKSILSDKQKIHLTVDQLTANFLEHARMIRDIDEVAELSAQELMIIAENRMNLNEIIALCQKYQLSIKTINVEEPSLEEVFLSLTGKSLRD